MAKSKPDKRNQKRKKNKPASSSELSPAMAQPLLEEATALLQTGQREDALPIAMKSLRCLAAQDVPPETQLPVLELIGEIHMELGDPDAARMAFMQAAKLDPNAELAEEDGGGAEKFLWLAQLSEEGGADSMQWFQKGFTVLRREIASADEALDEDEAMIIEEKKAKLANALCGAAEVYMTDLSWEEDAEHRCESFVTEACMVAPESPEPLQTLASVRISQSKLEDARSALQRSLDMWTSLPPEHLDIPDFPTRISLARLLMEAQMEDRAMDVLERSIAEDDSSVEAWYLGGWCLYLIGMKDASTNRVANGGSNGAVADDTSALRNSRKWLMQSLKLYTLQDYEDDRLKDHADDLVKELDEKLGPDLADNDDDEDGWESEGEDEADEEMVED